MPTAAKVRQATKVETTTKRAVRCGGSVFSPYPDAVVAGGLVFTSGVRAAVLDAGFPELPKAARAKQQGYALVDRQEGLASAGSWGAHESLEKVLRAAGSENAQILRQHYWQKDKRFFPSYERVRMEWQPAPAPSSGLGVGTVTGPGEHWVGIDAIAVAPGADPRFPKRAVLAGVDQKELPAASHYSQAVRAGPLVFTAGHIPIKTSAPGKPVVQGFDDVDARGRFLATGRSHPDSRDGPIAAQTWYVYDELRKLLARAGLGLDDVLLSCVFLADLRDLPVFHRIHAQVFGKQGPALCIAGFDEVGHRGCRIEIELTALAPKSGLAVKRIGWKVPAPLGAPAAIAVGPFVFSSSMPGLDSKGRVGTEAALPRNARAWIARLARLERKSGLAAQTWLAFTRLAEAMAGAGASLDDLAKLTVYLEDQADLAIVDAVRADFISKAQLPAFECVAVRAPGPDVPCRVQLEAIGYRP